MTGIIPTAEKPGPKPKECNIREQVIAARNKTGVNETVSESSEENKDVLGNGTGSKEDETGSQEKDKPSSTI